MKKAMIETMQKPHDDELYTPRNAVLPLLPYLANVPVCWEPTDPGNSAIAAVLRASGRVVISTHKSAGGDPYRLDFLRDDPPSGVGAIVTNPPYSLKDDFLARAYEFGLPFAFLLPLTALEGVRRGRLYRNNGLQLLVLDRRAQFLRGPGKSCWFNTSWFCWRLLPRDLLFAELPAPPGAMPLFAAAEGR